MSHSCTSTATGAVSSESNDLNEAGAARCRPRIPYAAYGNRISVRQVLPALEYYNYSSTDRLAVTADVPVRACVSSGGKTEMRRRGAWHGTEARSAGRACVLPPGCWLASALARALCGGM